MQYGERYRGKIMMKTIFHKLRWGFVPVCILICILIWQGYIFLQPSVEELKEFIGKSEEELYRQFGPPKSVWTILWSEPMPEEGADEKEWEAWEEWNELMEWYPKRTLGYGGNVYVDVNIHGRIVNVYRGISRGKQNAEELQKLIDKTRRD